MLYDGRLPILCSQCLLRVNAWQVDLGQTVLIGGRGIEWTSSAPNLNPDMVFNINDDYISIPIIFKDTYGNEITENALQTGQTLTATFTSGTNPRPSFCYEAQNNALELCDFATEWPIWEEYRSANTNENFRLDLSGGTNGGLATFRADLKGSTTADYDVDSLPLQASNF